MTSFFSTIFVLLICLFTKLHLKKMVVPICRAVRSPSGTSPAADAADARRQLLLGWACAATPQPTIIHHCWFSRPWTPAPTLLPNHYIFYWCIFRNLGPWEFGVINRALGTCLFLTHRRDYLDLGSCGLDVWPYLKFGNKNRTHIIFCFLFDTQWEEKKDYSPTFQSRVSK